MQRLSQYSWDEIFHTTQRFCSLDPEVLVKSDLERLLREFKVLDMNNVVSEVFFTLDPMQFGGFYMILWCFYVGFICNYCVLVALLLQAGSMCRSSWAT